MRLLFVDRTEASLSWIAEEPAYMQRAGHALAEDGRVWLVDPVDGPGLELRLADLGEPAAVLQLFERHPRDCAALAGRLGVPHLRLPYDGVPGSSFQAICLGRRRLWREVALWWPRQAALVVPESLGTVAYFRSGDARCGVHPMRRLAPPSVLAGYAPQRLLVGHGPPFDGDGVSGEVAAALARSRRDTPRWLAGLPGARSRARHELDGLAAEG